jgi:hypothetical protein
MLELLSQNDLTYNNRIVDRNSKTTVTERISYGRVRCIDVYEMSLWSLNCFFKQKVYWNSAKELYSILFLCSNLSPAKKSNSKILRNYLYIRISQPRKPLVELYNALMLIYDCDTNIHTYKLIFFI